MEEPQTKLAKNTLKFTFKISASKAEDHVYPHQRSNNGISFWALLICVFLYISIFYLFNLSPLVLFNTNKFWFLISNTLILIIAADSGAFSSSKPNIPSPLDQLLSTPQYNLRAYHTPNNYTNCVVLHQENNDALKSPQKATINSQYVVVAGLREFRTHEKSNTDFPPNKSLPDNNTSEHLVEIYEHKEKVVDDVKDCQRSKSERANRFIGGGDEGDKIRASRSSTQKYDETESVDHDYEKDPFSGMSDEEVNKRVEEFIRRFYNQQLR